MQTLALHSIPLELEDICRPKLFLGEFGTRPRKQGATHRLQFSVKRDEVRGTLESLLGAVKNPVFRGARWAVRKIDSEGRAGIWSPGSNSNSNSSPQADVLGFRHLLHDNAHDG